MVLFLMSGITCLAQNGESLAPPVVRKQWVQPAQGKPAQPVWGHKNGIRIGLSPLSGPRGLIRIYTPYLDHKEGRVTNFIALEPIAKDNIQRSFSELEMSKLDNKRGKRFWTANDSTGIEPRQEEMPASGVIENTANGQTLTLFIFSEEFESGAKVYLRVRFHSDKPYEIELSTYSAPGSNELSYLIVTATMGNFARLRNLYLDSNTYSSHQLWPGYSGDAFTNHAHFPASKFIRDKNGRGYFIAAPDEVNPSNASYEKSTENHWKYYGKKATQYWYCKDDDDLEGLVNGRYTYWASRSPIPGGIAFENFELKAPFKEGRTYVFGITPLKPEDFIRELKKDK
jgi:hypothetical protein